MYRPVNSVRFYSIPKASVRQALKDHGFRWNRVAQAWQAPQSITSATVASFFAGWDVQREFTDADADALATHIGERGMEAACGII